MGLDYEKTLSSRAIRAELKSPLFWRDVVVEGLSCTVLMVFVVLVMLTLNEDHYKPNVLHFGLFAGFLVFLLIEGYGPICGAHLNSAASIALCVAGHITPLRAVAYVCAQILGVSAGAGIGFLLNPPNVPYYSLKPSDQLNAIQCVFIEACLTFNLLFVAICVNDSKGHPKSSLPALATGFCIGVGILTAGTHTGGLQNPLVPFGPAILSGDWERHWVYWVGPILGGIAGALTYEATQWMQRRYAPKSLTEFGPDGLTEDGVHNYLAPLQRRSGAEEPNAYQDEELAVDATHKNA